ncbi:helix-turn-helix domain-containing protein [Anaerosporobacter faecicola]|uniref:helix-turn-helix domain-containing protein n=1 Tax=Anaerosporobacter faecicola TaxID=2718714 RepID=UPI00143881E8|nr:AraC family transcriptional regulator [Anaerosporobacter faecicola]
MGRRKKTIIEYRNYELLPYFPVLLLTGEKWRISDIPSGRLHFHNCLEIGLCETDSGTMEFMDTIHSFSAGDVTIVASDIPHTTYSKKGTSSKWSYLFLDIEELFHPFFQLHSLENSTGLHRLLHDYSAILSRNTYPNIHTLVTMIIQELVQKKQNYQFTVRGLAVALMTNLLNIYSQTEAHPTIQIHENSLAIAPALDYMELNYRNTFSMDCLANECNLSPSHFRRLFLAIMNMTPLDYLNNLRVQKASVLLRSTEIPILLISEDVGFGSLSSFNRHFYNKFGKTPREWRSQLSYIRNQSIQMYSGWLLPPSQ